MLRPERYTRLSAGSPTTYLNLHRTKELKIPCQGRTPHPAVVCACVAAGSLQLDHGIWLAVVEQTAYASHCKELLSLAECSQTLAQPCP